jgi:hypothetical protein
VIRNLHKHQQREERGDVLIRGLWQKGTDAIIDVHITDLDAKSNVSRSPMKVFLEVMSMRRRSASIWKCVWNNFAISRRLSSPLMVSSARRQG